MAGQNLKKINGLLNAIRDPNHSVVKKNQALRQLESEVNKLATTEEDKFKASLDAFDAQWEKFQRAHPALVSTVDAKEVELLMQQLQDEIRIERRIAKLNTASDEDLERRFAALRDSNRAPEIKLSAKDAQIGQASAQRSTIPLDFVDDLVKPINEIEINLKHLEDSTAKKSTSIVSPIAQKVRDNKPLFQEELLGPPRLSKSNNMGEVFLKKIKSFLTFMTDIFKPVSLDSAIDKLDRANRELKTVGTRLKNDIQRLFNISEALVEKKNELDLRFRDQQKISKNLTNQLKLLHELQSDPTKKEEVVKLKEKIAMIKNEREKIKADVIKSTSELRNLTDKSKEIHIGLEEPRQMHKTAMEAVKKGVGELEKASKKNKENVCVDKQHRLKDLLHSAKESFNHAEKISNIPNDDPSPSSFRKN